jgi:four helix bundle protein
VNEMEFKRQTKDIALRVIRVFGSLPKSAEAQVLGRQLLRSGTSIGANYRAACRAVSRADMMSKLGDVEEEADETLYWMELLIDAKIVPEAKLGKLMSDVNRILGMVVKSIRTIRSSSATQNPKSKTQK